MSKISNVCKAGLVLVSVAGIVPVAQAEPVLVDIGQDQSQVRTNVRLEVGAKFALNWLVPEKEVSNAEFDLGNGVHASLKPAGKGQLRGVLWKGGLDVDANFASDGVVATEGDTILLTISGLTPGYHTLATFHNAGDANSYGLLQVRNPGETSRETRGPLLPSYQVPRDDEAGSEFFEFRGSEVTIEVTPFQPGGTAILNGFELDGSNPRLRATHFSPADGDEHTIDKPQLSWTAGQNAAAHRIFFGTNRDAVAKAEKSSQEYKGEQTARSYKIPAGLDHMKTYFWRVDEVQQDGTVTHGNVATFRVRHLAFPGAEGYGRFARGGRGGRVIEVTNLEDSGPGSLRAAIEAEGPRTVVFRVGGTIQLKSRLTIKNPYITIAGQTAPGDGIAVRDAAFEIGGSQDEVNGGTQDAIMRFIRIRVGDESGKTWDGTGFGRSDHCIIDHCSIAWSIDEGVSGRGSRNITFQRNIITEPLHMSVHDHYQGSGKGHGFGGSISGDIGSYHHNLIANSAGRNWSLAGGFTPGMKFAGNIDIRSNVVYNWYHRTNDGGVRRLNLVGNYYIPGPASKVFHLLKAVLEIRRPGDIQQYYVQGNRMEGRPQYDADNWQNGGVIFDAKDVADMKVDRPFYESYVTPHSALESYASVMADVGASIPAYDSVDQRAIQNTLGRTTTFKGSRSGIPGIPDSQNDVGGYPELKNGTPPADNDHDGMADWWEQEHGLNPADPEDRNGIGAGGYTNLELYLNWIVDNGGLEKKTDHVSAMELAERAALQTRAGEITAQLGLEDKAKADRVTKNIAEQYRGLYDLLDKLGTKLRAFADATGGEKAFGGQTYENVMLQTFAELKPQLDAQRARYLAALGGELTPEQIDRVKDAMTGYPLRVIYGNFVEMVPNLTDVQKQQIKAMLTEGRDRAMNGANDRQRRQWMAKYVGRANIYISKQGYDFRRLAREWMQKTGNSDVF